MDIKGIALTGAFYGASIGLLLGTPLYVLESDKSRAIICSSLITTATTIGGIAVNVIGSVTMQELLFKKIQDL